MISRSKLNSIKNSGNSEKKDIPPLTLADIRPLMGEVKQKGKEYVGTCPVCNKEGHLYAHEDRGKLLAYCQHCNADFKTIMTAFRDQGALPIDIVMEKHTEKKNKYLPTEAVENIVYEYKSPAGAIDFCKRRLKWADGHKEFRFFHFNDYGKAVNGKPDDTVYLYNIDLLTAADPSQTLYIVEGEKCADAMTEHGFLATTSCIGAKKEIKLTETDEFALNKFADKVIIPDNDAKGMEYARAAEWGGAKILSLPEIWTECPEKGDVADYFAAGLPADAIRNYKFSVDTQPVPVPDKDSFAEMDVNELLSTESLSMIYNISVDLERQQVLGAARQRAKKLKITRDFDACWKAFLAQKAIEFTATDGNTTGFTGQPLQLRCGDWMADDSGIRRKATKDGLKFYVEWGSPIPVMPVEILVNIEENTEKIRIGYCKEGSWRTFMVDRSIVASNNSIVRLANRGLEVNSENAKLMVRYIADCVAKNPDILPRIQSVSHLGWIKNEFLPYCDEIKLDCEDQYKSIVTAMQPKGSLKQWVDYVKSLRKNIYLRLIMAAAFASPLIARVNALPFVLHLWGGTGTGKTAGAMVAASIWGDPDGGKMVRTMNMTVNSMMSTAAVLKNIPFIGDELQTIKSRYENYDTLIMRICEGINRGRLNAEMQLQKPETWANAFIFTGEEPCTQSASGGGVKNRVIEIECDEEIIGKNGNKIVNFVKKHYGTAGPAFIEAILTEQETKDIAEQYQLYFDKIMKGCDTTEKQAMAMALMWLGDTIAEDHIFKTYDYLELEQLAPFMKSISEIDTSERAFEMVTDLIGENQTRFVRVDNRFPVEHNCWGEFETHTTVLMNKTVLERELTEMGFSFNAVKKKWARKGYLMKNSQDRFIWQTSVQGVMGNFIKLNLKNLSQKM